MPDLSHRPTRYAVAAVSLVALAAATASTLDVRLGRDPALAAAKKEAAQLEERLRDLRRQRHQKPRAVRDSAPAETSSRGAPSSLQTNGSLSCTSYPHQEAAQQVFTADPIRFAVLDGDGDGRACEQLKSEAAPPGTRIVGEPPAPPQNELVPAGRQLPETPTKAEIVVSGQHFGLAAATTEEFDSLEYGLARDATLHGYYRGWDTDYDEDRVIASWQRGEIPVMTWESRPLANLADTTDYSLHRIASGAFDDYLTTYAREITALGLPLIIRFDHEMNGNWYRWSEFDSPYGNHPGDYIAAWRRVHDVFQAQGANDHVVWLWSPNRVDNLGRFPAIDNYYPGPGYVDWVGMTGYYRPGDREASFAATYDKTLAELRRVAPGKPILLAEVGATEDGGNKVGWVQSFFPGLAANPDVTGFVWFNHAVTDAGHTNDWRLNSSPSVFESTAEGLEASGYGRERGKRAVLVPRTISEPPPAAVPAPVFPMSVPSTSVPSTSAPSPPESSAAEASEPEPPGAEDAEPT